MALHSQRKDRKQNASRLARDPVHVYVNKPDEQHDQFYTLTKHAQCCPGRFSAMLTNYRNSDIRQQAIDKHTKENGWLTLFVPSRGGKDSDRSPDRATVALSSLYQRVGAGRKWLPHLKFYPGPENTSGVSRRGRRRPRMSEQLQNAPRELRNEVF